LLIAILMPGNLRHVRLRRNDAAPLFVTRIRYDLTPIFRNNRQTSRSFAAQRDLYSATPFMPTRQYLQFVMLMPAVHHPPKIPLLAVDRVVWDAITFPPTVGARSWW
jgi:hypothetical protein